MGKNQFQRKRFFYSIGVLFILAIAIRIFSLFPGAVERGYTRGFYNYLSQTLRAVFRLVPVSLGDILYALFLISLVVWVVKGILQIRRSKNRKALLGAAARKLLLWSLGIYVYFNLAWGLNYDRLGIASDFGLEEKEYTIAELKALNTDLLLRINETRKACGSSPIYPTPRNLYKEVDTAYQKTASFFPFLQYQYPCIKSSLFGRLGNYLGYLGYYNPFTGEAQVNTAVPAFTLPYTACHETAHQLGYGSESEANFVGYIAAVHSGRPEFVYSAYFNLFSYANSRLYEVDSVAAKENVDQLDTLVKQDYLTYKQFLLAHQNPVEPLLTRVYGWFLQANKQPLGILTYDDVVGWLIAYKEKFGKI